jgi:hypothetical protein
MVLTKDTREPPVTTTTMMITMKYVMIIVLGAAVAGAAARPVPFSATKLAVVQIPRGGGVFGTQLTKENLACVFVLQMAINGAIGLPAPEKLVECYGGAASKPGTAKDVFWHYVGSGSSATAIMAYLSVFTDIEASEIAFWGILPCIYQAWAMLLRGSKKAAGFHEGMGVGAFLSLLPAFLLITGKGNSDLIIKYFVLFSAIDGLVASFGNDDMVKFVYGVSIVDGTSSVA